MPKSVIAIDCDDVIVDFNGAFSRYHNNWYGTTVTYDAIFTHDMPVIYGCSVEEIHRRVDDFYRSPEHTVMQAIPGAAEALKILAAQYELHVVTSRPAKRRPETELSIALHFPDLFTDLHFTNGFAGEVGDVKRTKSEVCRIIDAKLLVEDAPQHVAEVSANGIQVVMPDRPWNQGKIPARVIRSFSWDETVTFATQNVG